MKSFKALRVEDSYRSYSWFASSVAMTSLSPLNFHVSPKVKKYVGVRAHQPAINLSPVKFRYRRSSISRNAKSLLMSVTRLRRARQFLISMYCIIFLRGIVYYIFSMYCTYYLLHASSALLYEHRYQRGLSTASSIFLCVIHSLASLPSEILYSYNERPHQHPAIYC